MQGDPLESLTFLIGDWTATRGEKQSIVRVIRNQNFLHFRCYEIVDGELLQRYRMALGVNPARATCAAGAEKSHRLHDAAPKGGEYLSHRHIFTSYDRNGHDAWSDTYCQPHIYQWLLRQRITSVGSVWREVEVGSIQIMRSDWSTCWRNGIVL